jgi:hypothetical protein
MRPGETGCGQPKKAENIEMSKTWREALITVMEPLRPSTECLGLGNLPARLDDQTLAELDTIRDEPCPGLEPCDQRHLGQCLRTMLAVLPRRNSDDLGGELFVAAYQRMLGGYPKAQVSFVTEQAMARCKWFPTIAECLEIAGEWVRRDQAFLDWREKRSTAKSLIQAEMNQRDADRRFANSIWLTQDDVDGMPPHILAMAMECGNVIRDESGKPILKPGRF